MNTHQRALQIVRAVGEINFVGNVVPHSWYKHLTLPNGKPYIVAITILSEIVYWYRPLVLKDEATGRVLPPQKKFSEDKYRKSYGEFAEQFGFSKRQVIDAISYLKAQGVLTTEVKKTAVVQGILKGNVLYIEVVPARLQAISALPDEDAIADGPSTPPEVEGQDLQGQSLTPSRGRASACAGVEPLPLEGVSLKGTKTPPQIPSETPAETPPQSRPVGVAEEGAAAAAESPAATAAAAETRQALFAEGILALTEFADVPTAVIRAAALDTRLPQGHEARPAFIVKRLRAWRNHTWAPPANRARAPAPAPAPTDGVWTAVCAQLRPQIPPDAFLTAVEASRLLLLDDAVAVISAPHVFARDALQPYAELIMAALGEVTGAVRPIELVIGEADP
jgi:hypothetical protein